MKKWKILMLLSVLIAALTMFLGCSDYKLDTPTGFTFSEDDSLTLMWEEVTDARAYDVEILDCNSGDAQTSQTKKAEVSLSTLEEGEYEIRVRAVGGRDYDEYSSWSEAQNFQKEYENGCLYNLINNGTEWEVKKVGAAKGTFSIRSYYRNKAVTRIADAAFKGSRYVENIVIGENVEYIGENAFLNCRNLASVSIPSTVTTIGGSAFQGCGSLKEVVLPDKVTTIESYTFAYCKSLTSVKFGDAVSVLDKYAFLECSSLTEMAIPDTVERIGECAFSANTALTDLTIGKKVETIEKSAFYRCFALKKVTFSNESVLKEIGTSSFAGCRDLPAIVLPEGLEVIGSYAFESDAVLDSIVIPESVKQVGEKAFYNTKFYTDAIAAGDEFICAGTWLVDCTKEMKDSLTTITLESFKNGDDGQLLNVVGIADKVFANCTGLTSIKLPQSVKYVGAAAFANCTSLTKVETFDGLRTIGDEAFAGCKWLSNLNLGEGLERIGAYAFYGCEALANKTFSGTSLIPSTVTSIGTYAFKYTALWNEPDAETGIVYAGDWVVGYNGLRSARVTLRESTVGIADYAFYQCEDLRTLIWESDDANVREYYIGRAAFYGCNGLGSVTLPRRFSVINDYTFYKCSSLYSVELPVTLTSIGRSAFYKCESLNEIDLSSSRRLTSVGAYAFYGCANAQSLNLGTSLTEIGEYAFANCSSISSVVIPASVTTIEMGSFYHCAAAETLTIGENVTSIGVSAFNGCASLTSIVIPESVVTIENNAFYKCVAATELVIGSNVTKIGDYAFYGLENVGVLEIPKSVVSVGSCAFRGFKGLGSLTLASSVEQVGMHAVYGCNQATVYTDAETLPGKWHSRWNSSYRPVVWGCELSEEGYVVSVTITETTLSNLERAGTVITPPQRKDAVFEGWRAGENGELLSADELRNVAVGTTLYAVWTTVAE